MKHFLGGEKIVVDTYECNQRTKIVERFGENLR